MNDQTGLRYFNEEKCILYMAKTCITILLSISLLIVFSGSSKNQVTRQGPDEMAISYVGNMGVLINTGETSVLIDGLHEFYDHAYLNTPPVEIEKIIQRQPPYTNTTLALVTHYHKDHFSSTLSSRFLEASASNRLASRATPASISNRSACRRRISRSSSKQISRSTPRSRARRTSASAMHSGCAASGAPMTRP